MSDLDYSRSTGRGFGQSGSLRTDQMSSMQRGNAINREVGDQKRESAFERRLMRQLGRASRKGDIEAGMLGRELSLDAQARGAKVQGGIGSSEENRSVAAQSIFDRNDLTNQQDAATNGTPEQATPRASIRPANQSNPIPSPMPTSITSTLDGGARPPQGPARTGPAPPEPSPAIRELLDTPAPRAFSVSPERQAQRDAEDAVYYTRSVEREEKAQRDFAEGQKRNAEHKASRVTENWKGSRLDSPIGFHMGSTSETTISPQGRRIEKTTDNPTSTLTYAEKDKDGNQYRPAGWTQEDEDASAKGAGLDRFIRKYPVLDIMAGSTLSGMKGRAMGQIGKMKSSAAPVQTAKPKKRTN